MQTCPRGHFCPVGTAYAHQYPCPRGTYNGNLGSEAEIACITCEAGFYCIEGSVQNEQVCPSGHYCPVATGAYNEHPCPLGTFSGLVTGASALRESNPGHGDPVFSPRSERCCLSHVRVLDHAGLVDPSQCQNCTAGNFCPQGSIQPTGCPMGTYNPHAVTGPYCL